MGRIFGLKNIYKGNTNKEVNNKFNSKSLKNTLVNAKLNQEYIIKAIETKNDEIKNFLFTLGCYEGEIITVISVISGQYVVVIKDARYSIDKNLAETIII